MHQRQRFLTAEWRHLLMLNYEIDPAILKPIVPVGTELDTWNGKTFVSMVGFLFLKTKVLGIPVPFHRNFEEVNLRFYVRRQVGDEVRRGVVFIQEVVPRWAIAAIARWIYNEGYVNCRMDSRVQLPTAEQPRGSVEYGWGQGKERKLIGAEFTGTPSIPEPVSQEAFIAEHYWGYVNQRPNGVVEYAVEHPQWRVWSARNAQFECDVASWYGSQYAEALSVEPSSAFVAEGSPVTVYRGNKVEAV